MEVAQAEGIHFGYLLPWSQINSWTYFRMPWLQGEHLLKMHQYYSQLRSRLIPYIYSSAYYSSTSGMPMLMPLTLEFQNDPACRSIMHEYLLGSSLLVTAYKHDIYLPEGEWLDFWSGKVYSGNQHIDSFQWPENRGGGLFLRSGAIVPMGEVMSHTAEKVTDSLELVIYPGNAEHSEFTYYEDDGITFAYRDGKFAVSKYTLDRTANGWLLKTAPAADSQVKDYAVTFYGIPQNAKLLNNGSPLTGSFDPERGELKLVQIQPGTIEVIL